MKNHTQIDDALDVFAVHGLGGIFGTLMIAAFGYAAWAPQIGALVIVGLYTVVVTYALVRVVAWMTPLRVDRETETNGLDISVHGERAYELNS